MDLVPSVTQALVGAVVAGLFGLLTWWLTRRSERPARRNAWQKQAEALRNELRTVYTGQITDLQGRLTDSHVREMAASDAHDREIAAKDAEISRLNRLLNRQQQRGGGINNE